MKEKKKKEERGLTQQGSGLVRKAGRSSGALKDECMQVKQTRMGRAFLAGVAAPTRAWSMEAACALEKLKSYPCLVAGTFPVCSPLLYVLVSI